MAIDDDKLDCNQLAHALEIETKITGVIELEIAPKIAAVDAKDERPCIDNITNLNPHVSAGVNDNNNVESQHGHMVIEPDNQNKNEPAPKELGMQGNNVESQHGHMVIEPDNQNNNEPTLEEPGMQGNNEPAPEEPKMQGNTESAPKNKLAAEEPRMQEKNKLAPEELRMQKKNKLAPEELRMQEKNKLAPEEPRMQEKNKPAPEEPGMQERNKSAPEKTGMQEHDDAQEVQSHQATNDDDDAQEVQPVIPAQEAQQATNNAQEVQWTNNDAAGVAAEPKEPMAAEAQAINNDGRCSAQEVQWANNDAARVATEPKEPMAVEAQRAAGNTNKGVAVEVQQPAGVAGEMTATGLAETVNDAGMVVATNNDNIIMVATPAWTTELAPKKVTTDMIATYGKRIHHYQLRVQRYSSYGHLRTTMNTQTLITKQPVYAKQCKIEFWIYGQVHKSNNNTTTAQTIKVLSLRPSGNAQGGHYFNSINTGHVLNQAGWMHLPMSNEMITQVHTLTCCVNATHGPKLHD